MVRNKKKIVRASTVAMSIDFFDQIMRRMRDDGYEMVAVTSPGKQLDALREEGFHCVSVPMERHISLVKDGISLLKMIRVFMKEKPQVVHSMTPKAGLVCMMAAWLTRVPVRIHTFTGLVWPTATGMTRKILMLTDKILCACATHVIPEGEGVMNDLKNGGITKKPMKVLGYGNVKGVDMERFDPDRVDPNITLDSNYFTFLYVGRIVGDKGINELVEAFAKLHDKYKNTRLVLVGKLEEELDPLQQITMDIINANSSVVLAGGRYDDDLLREYMKCDCFIMPSYREGFPNTVMEAGAMNKPSIVTDINGSREIIKDGENGIIVPPRQMLPLYDAMERMITDKELRENMVKNARPMIESRFEKSFVQDCLINYYKEIMK